MSGRAAVAREVEQLACVLARAAPAQLGGGEPEQLVARVPGERTGSLVDGDRPLTVLRNDDGDAEVLEGLPEERHLYEVVGSGRHLSESFVA